MLLHCDDDGRCPRLFVLRLSGTLPLASFGEFGAQRRQLVHMELILCFESPDLVLLTQVDLLADSPAVLLDQARRLWRVAVGMIVDEHPHHVLRAELVLCRELTIVSRRIEEQHLVVTLERSLLTEYQQAGGDTGA